MSFFRAMPWHSGEEKMHKATNLPASDNPTVPGLPPYLGARLARSPLIALGTTNDEGKVWCTLLGGEAPIVQPVAAGGIIGIRAQADKSFDPVIQSIYGGRSDGEVIQQPPSQGRMISGLSIHLEDRDRVKLFGRMLAGSLDEDGKAQLVMQVTQSLGNCPKYLNKKSITPHTASPELLSDASTLSPEAIDHVHTADMFFIASKGPEDMDCNHRGGPPGFVRVESETSIVWPEYSGNNLYQTLGNITHAPSVGLVIPNYITGDVLYITGNAEVLINEKSAEVIAKTRLAVRLTITQQRLVKDGLNFRGAPTIDNRDVSSSHPTVERDITDGQSPYNPRVRYLVPKNTHPGFLPPDECRRAKIDRSLKATLVDKKALTPTITRYRFKMSTSDGSKLGEHETLWTPGQYVALDFSEELYMGYSHMNDSSPSSLNDDYIRTFTVSKSHVPGVDEFEITVRNVGTVTRWLSRQNIRSAINIEVKGFAGDFAISTDERSVFVAAGIGITPFLGAGKDNLYQCTVLWTLAVADIGLALDVVGELSAQARKRLNIFVTGVDKEDSSSEHLQTLEDLQAQVKVNRRRLTKLDLTELDAEGESIKWYLCMTPAMRKQVQEWLEHRTMIFENFDY